MTRVNLLLNLGSEAELLPEISFRVFQADSILLPEQLVGAMQLDQRDETVRLPLVIGDLDLPRVLSSIDGVHALVRVIEAALDAGRQTSLFKVRLTTELRDIGLPEDSIESAVDPAATIYERLAELKAEQRDGIWAKVIEQAFAPTLLGQVDLVVGNPPWISWKNTPQAWQDRSESLWRSFGLWQRKRRGGGVPLADLSTLLFARSIATYAPDGIVALLLPQSFLMADPGSRAIRTCHLSTRAEDLVGVIGPVDKPFRPLHVDDFSTLSPFPDAATTPIAVYVRPGARAKFPVPATRWLRARAGVRLPPALTWSEARRRLAGTDVVLSRLHESDSGAIWVEAAPAGSLEALPPASEPNYRWGQGFHTRGADGLYYCNILSARPSGDGLVRIRSCPEVGDITRDEEPREGVVEAAYLWPLLRGEGVNRLSVVAPDVYCIVPHDPDDLATPLSAQDLASRAPRLFDFLEPLIPRLAARSAYDLDLSEEKPFAIQGALQYLSQHGNYVASRYIAAAGRPPTSPVIPSLDHRLARVTAPYFNNKSNFLKTQSEDEAWFVATFFNAPGAQALLGRISMSTVISPRKLASVPVPRFDARDDRHRRLVELGKSAVGESSWADRVWEIDALVVDLGELELRAPAELEPGPFHHEPARRERTYATPLDAVSGTIGTTGGDPLAREHLARLTRAIGQLTPDQRLVPSCAPNPTATFRGLGCSADAATGQAVPSYRVYRVSPGAVGRSGRLVRPAGLLHCVAFLLAAGRRGRRRPAEELSTLAYLRTSLVNRSLSSACACHHDLLTVCSCTQDSPTDRTYPLDRHATRSRPEQ